MMIKMMPKQMIKKMKKLIQRNQKIMKTKLNKAKELTFK